jgi:RNA polymerase sigma-70 factor, ECF subfamily
MTRFCGTLPCWVSGKRSRTAASVEAQGAGVRTRGQGDADGMISAFARMPETEITLLLNQLSGGDRGAFDRLFSLVYDELRRLASHYMRHERGDHTLQTTALVNEAYVRLVNRDQAGWKTRLHFFAVASTVMRHVLVDHARARNSARRGGGVPHVSLDGAAVITEERADEILAIDRALGELAALDQRQAQVVELRYFGGLTLAEAADFLNTSPDTVSRDWNSAKAFLYRRIGGNRRS